MKLYTKNLYTEKVNVFFSYALLVWVFVFTTKTFFSGFHLSDDQILIYFNNHLHQQSFFSAAYSEIKSDLFLRFRPLAIFYYLTLAKWPYPDFNIISLIVGWQGIFSCYFFYRFARDLKCSLAVSFMFPLFLLCGNQGVIFWRNCVNETFAIFLLSLSFFFLGKLFSTKINERWNTILFALFLLLSTLTKESFIILVPAVLFLKIWKEVINYNGFLFSLKQNKKLIIFFIIIVITEIATIYYYKKHSSIFIEYVSIDENTFSITNLLTSTIRLWITKGYLIIIIPVITFIIFIKKKYTPEDIRSFFLPLALLFLLITIPQILLYSKSLIFERYLLPGTLSSALAIPFFTSIYKAQPIHTFFK